MRLQSMLFMRQDHMPTHITLPLLPLTHLMGILRHTALLCIRLIPHIITLLHRRRRRRQDTTPLNLLGAGMLLHMGPRTRTKACRREEGPWIG